MDKKAIVEILDEMGTLLELPGANPFTARAFHNASRAVEGLTTDLVDLVESGKLLDIDGVGESIAGVITDLALQDGSREYEKLRRGTPSGVLQMLRVQGLGPKKVRILHQKLKIKSLEELEKAARGDRLSSVAGFGRKTQENILKGIQALRVRGEKAIYPKARDAAERVFHDVMKRKEIIRGEIAGSLRRKKEIIGDIDLVVSAGDSSRPVLMDTFTTHPDVEAIVAKGETKSSVLLKAGINCDMRIVDDSEFPFALNYFTGSKEHNVEMRSRARKYGWSLNEYGFSDVGAEETRGKSKRIVPCTDERDIYKALDLDYVEPELRENLGEVEAAEKGTLPTLVEFDDIRGTFHCHTKYSDGVNTIDEMAAAARKLGWEYLGIGDHSKAAAYAGGMNEQKVRKQLKEIETLNSRGRFRVFSGTECDILPTGDLDWPDDVLASFDYVVASVHSGFNMSQAAMTKRIIKALTHRHVTMLGHPTGRLLLSREGYPVDMVQVINAASDHGKIIEINAHPLRLDLDWRLCKSAQEKGVLLAINPDAHNVDGLNDVRYGVGVARKGWLRREDVLNTQSTSAVAKRFSRH
jgi:DNA polymerase (family 10)